MTTIEKLREHEEQLRATYDELKAELPREALQRLRSALVHLTKCIQALEEQA